MLPALLRHPIQQYAFVVPDLDEGIRHWSEVMGAGPFTVLRDYLGPELTYRGAPSSTRVHYAFGQAGPVMIQLIAQGDEGPSIYRDMYPAGTGGFHHVCALVSMDEFDDQVQAFVDAGFPVAATLMTSAPVAYLDCRSAVGCFVELYGRSERVTAFFDSVRRAHEEGHGAG